MMEHLNIWIWDEESKMTRGERREAKQRKSRKMKVSGMTTVRLMQARVMKKAGKI